jgi:integrase
MAARRTKRADGRYAVTFTFEGKRYFGYGKTQAEAKHDAEDKRRGLEAGGPVRNSTRTLANWIGEWEDTFLQAAPLADSTRDNYSIVLRKHVVPLIGHLPLSKLRATDVVRVITTMQANGKAGSTQRTVRTALIRVLRDAQRNGLLRENPAEKTDRPRITHREARSLTDDEAVAFFKAAEGLRYASALLLALYTGLRRGEVLALRWDQVDLDAGYLRVEGSLVRRGGHLIVAPTKTEKSRRTLKLQRKVLALLQEQMVSQGAERSRAGNLWQETGHVFTTELGGPVDPRNLLRTAKIAQAKAGLAGNIGVHTMRHTAATARLLSGIPAHVVAGDLGHSDPTITLSVYAHVTDTAAYESALAGEDYFSI